MSEPLVIKVADAVKLCHKLKLVTINATMPVARIVKKLEWIANNVAMGAANDEDLNVLLANVIDAVKSGDGIVIEGGDKPFKAKPAAKEKAAKPVKKEKTKAKSKSTAKPVKKRDGFSGVDAAAEVLKKAKEPLTGTALVKLMAEKGLWAKADGSPAYSSNITRAIAKEIKEKGKEARFKIIGNTFTLA